MRLVQEGGEESKYDLVMKSPESCGTHLWKEIVRQRGWQFQEAGSFYKDIMS